MLQIWPLNIKQDFYVKSKRDWDPKVETEHKEVKLEVELEEVQLMMDRLDLTMLH